MRCRRRVALGNLMLALSSCERMVTGINRAWLGEGPPPGPVAPPDGREIDPDFHLLSRASFGPWPGDLERLKSMGAAAWIEQQLHPESIADHACDLRAERFESVHFSAGNAYEFRKPVLRAELTRHTLLRAMYSRRQLLEVMVEFWTDHLNIDLEKGDCIYLKPSDDREVIRRHALGNFRELIRASATSPAMLVYLDGQANRVRAGNNDKPNENYARELMELHTMGVHGGYSQRDVYEAARCLSGWSFDRNRFWALNQGKSFFRADWHDDGAKTVLGHDIPAGGGAQDLDRLVDIVCSHPSTARFIAGKLCRRLVSAKPAEELVQRVAAEFSRTQGDIKAMLRLIFASREFAASPAALLKRPFKFMVSAMRALLADTQANSALLEPLQRMGQGLFQHPTPDGYPDEELPWMGTLLWRWNFAMALAANAQSGVRVDVLGLRRELGFAPAQWFAQLVGRRPTAQEAAVFEGGDEIRAVGLILASPAFQRC